jgi:hypothetical protein
VDADRALAQLARRRRAQLGALGDLTPAQLHTLRARWFALKFRGVVGLVERIVADETHGSVATQPHSRDNP